jgi:membrane fusion protein (multidrug efflux system)
MGIVPLVAVIAGGIWYLASERYVSTDDAYAQASMVQVSADVAGRVVAVPVQDNQYVKAGSVLLRIDDRPFRIAVERAEAQLESARLQVESLRATYKQQLADLQAAQDTANYQQREFERQQRLLAAHISSQSQFDAAAHALDVARQQAANAQQQIASTLASLAGDPNIATERHPLVMQAQAQLDQARLDLAHTIVTAPENGIVTKVSQLPVGNFLAAGTPGFALVETDHVWIDANFKETELTHMQPGQAATVTADAYPGVTYRARVASETPGTGAVFSVLPPQNATGNWVKVVQRLPVRLAIDAPQGAPPLAPGMSVTVRVDTRYRSPVLARLGRVFG